MVNDNSPNPSQSPSEEELAEVADEPVVDAADDGDANGPVHGEGDAPPQVEPVACGRGSAQAR